MAHGWLDFTRVREPAGARHLHYMPEKRRQKAPKGATTCTDCPQAPQPKNGLYLGLRGSKCDSEGTQSTRNTPLFVVSTPSELPGP